MSSFKFHVVRQSMVSDLGSIVGIAGGKEISILVSCDSPSLTEKIVKSITDHLVSCEIEIHSYPASADKVCLVQDQYVRSLRYVMEKLLESARDLIVQIPDYSKAVTLAIPSIDRNKKWGPDRRGWRQNLKYAESKGRRGGSALVNRRT